MTPHMTSPNSKRQHFLQLGHEILSPGKEKEIEKSALKKD